MATVEYTGTVRSDYTLVVNTDDDHVVEFVVGGYETGDVTARLSLQEVLALVGQLHLWLASH